MRPTSVASARARRGEREEEEKRVDQSALVSLRLSAPLYDSLQQLFVTLCTLPSTSPRFHASFVPTLARRQRRRRNSSTTESFTTTSSDTNIHTTTELLLLTEGEER